MDWLRVWYPGYAAIGPRAFFVSAAGQRLVIQPFKDTAPSAEVLLSRLSESSLDTLLYRPTQAWAALKKTGARFGKDLELTSTIYGFNPRTLRADLQLRGTVTTKSGTKFSVFQLRGRGDYIVTPEPGAAALPPVCAVEFQSLSEPPAAASVGSLTMKARFPNESGDFIRLTFENPLPPEVVSEITLSSTPASHWFRIVNSRGDRVGVVLKVKQGVALATADESVEIDLVVDGSLSDLAHAEVQPTKQAQALIVDAFGRRLSGESVRITSGGSREFSFSPQSLVLEYLAGTANKSSTIFSYETTWNDVYRSQKRRLSHWRFYAYADTPQSDRPGIGRLSAELSSVRTDYTGESLDDITSTVTPTRLPRLSSCIQSASLQLEGDGRAETGNLNVVYRLEPWQGRPLFLRRLFSGLGYEQLLLEGICGLTLDSSGVRPTAERNGVTRLGSAYRYYRQFWLRKQAKQDLFAIVDVKASVYHLLDGTDFRGFVNSQLTLPITGSFGVVLNVQSGFQAPSFVREDEFSLGVQSLH